MKHFLIILSLLLAGSANCQEQDTALVADTATTLLSDQQLFELGKKDGLAKVGKGTSPFFSSAAYVNGWNEGTQMQSVSPETRKLFRVDFSVLEFDISLSHNLQFGGWTRHEPPFMLSWGYERRSTKSNFSFSRKLGVGLGISAAEDAGILFVPISAGVCYPKHSLIPELGVRFMPGLFIFCLFCDVSPVVIYSGFYGGLRYETNTTVFRIFIEPYHIGGVPLQGVGLGFGIGSLLR